MTTIKVRRLLIAGMVGALTLSLLPVSSAVADTAEVCEGAPVTVFGDQSSIADDFVDNVNCMAAYGITRGVDEVPNFAPGDPVTRQQMATFIARMMVQAEEGSTDIPAGSPAAFTDVTADNNHYAAINWLAELGVTTGVTDTTYEPGRNVTREQMATFIARSLRELDLFEVLDEQQVLDDFEGQAFPDLDEGAAVHVPNIELLQALGVIRGRGDGTYAPTAEVTRQQMSQFIMEAAAVLERAGLWNGQFVGVDPTDPTDPTDPDETPTTPTDPTDPDETPTSPTDPTDPEPTYTLTLDGDATVFVGDAVELTATLTDDDGPVADTGVALAVFDDPDAIFDAAGLVDVDAAVAYTPVEDTATDAAGEVSYTLDPQPEGEYVAVAWAAEENTVDPEEALAVDTLAYEVAFGPGLTVLVDQGSPFIDTLVEVRAVYLDEDLAPIEGARVGLAVFEGEALDALGDFDLPQLAYADGVNPANGELLVTAEQTGPDGSVEFAPIDTSIASLLGPWQAELHEVVVFTGPVGTDNLEDAVAWDLGSFELADGPAAIALESTVTTTGVLPYGTGEVLAATIEDPSGEPLAIAGVEFELVIQRVVGLDPPAMLANQYATTDAAGVAIFDLESPEVPPAPTDDTVYTYSLSVDLAGDGVYGDLPLMPAGDTTWTSDDPGIVDGVASSFSIPSNSNVDDQYSALVDSTVAITAEVLDRFGGPIDEVLVEFSVAGVTFDRTTNEQGIATLQYTGPAAPTAQLVLAQVDADDDGVVDLGLTTPALNPIATLYWVVEAADGDTGNAATVLLGFDTDTGIVDVEVDGTPNDNRRVPFDADDQFQVNAAPVTLAAFVAALEDDTGVGSTLEFTYNEGGVSLFALVP